MTTQQLFVRLLAVVLGALLLAGCAQDPGTVRIVSGNMRFTPDAMQLVAGQPVTLTLVNTDGYGHSFDIDAFDIHVPMPAGTTATVTFTPDASGQYAFYCGAAGHQKAGMVGTLTVGAAVAAAAAGR